MQWLQVLPHVWLYRDSCNVYALEGPEGMLLVNAGTGRWLNCLDQLPSRPVALALTHYFRDHSAGAILAARAGILVYVPEYEHELLSDPAEHFRRRETYIIYDNMWDLFAPIEPIPVFGVLRDYETIQLAGLEVEVLPLPGVTISQSGLAFTVDGQKVVCCGEAIHSPGRVARVAPFQYNYNDLTGAVNCYTSAQWLRDHGAEVLLPSLGEPMLNGADEALVQLQQSLRVLNSQREGNLQAMDLVHENSVSQITEHVWQSHHAHANNFFIVSDSGKCLALDYGYSFPIAPQGAYAYPTRRRALLHSLNDLRRLAGVERIDVVLVSHFHDDHVCGIPVLQRLYGTECWAAENFADLLEQPAAHCFPCNWPVPTRVNRRIGLDEEVEWEGFRFHLGAMNGHTRFSALIGFEADGKRYAHTGDQYFLQMKRSERGVRPEPGNYGRMEFSPNYVYRNGALLDGYKQSGDWMLEWRPDIIISGHRAPVYTDDEYFNLIQQWGEQYAAIHQQAMALGDEETHFNLDSWGGWIWPYRTHLSEPGPVTVTVTVRNPYPRPAKLDVRLVGPQGWQGSTAELQADARAEVSTELTLVPVGFCRRQPFAVELVADGQPFGQVAEALVTIGGDWF